MTCWTCASPNSLWASRSAPSWCAHMRAGVCPSVSSGAAPLPQLRRAEIMIAEASHGSAHFVHVCRAMCPGGGDVGMTVAVPRWSYPPRFACGCRSTPTPPADMCALYARALRSTREVRMLCGDDTGGAAGGAGADAPASLSLERDQPLIDLLVAKEGAYGAARTYYAACAFAANAKVGLQHSPNTRVRTAPTNSRVRFCAVVGSRRVVR